MNPVEPTGGTCSIAGIPPCRGRYTLDAAATCQPLPAVPQSHAAQPKRAYRRSECGGRPGELGPLDRGNR
jgi:hypothetical protein